jgi:hypothetical protein
MMRLPSVAISNARNVFKPLRRIYQNRLLCKTSIQLKLDLFCMPEKKVYCFKGCLQNEVQTKPNKILSMCTVTELKGKIARNSLLIFFIKIAVFGIMTSCSLVET